MRECKHVSAGFHDEKMNSDGRRHGGCLGGQRPYAQSTCSGRVESMEPWRRYRVFLFLPINLRHADITSRNKPVPAQRPD
jgi:hypothetical protein